MYFSTTTPQSRVQNWFNLQLSAVMPVAKDGIDVEIKPHKKPRTIQQNRFFMAIMVALVRFYNETGFMPDGCKPWMMRTTVLKEYWKDRCGVASTSKLSASDFGKLCDFVQQTLIEETQGNWELLEPDSAYMRALCEQGGLE